MPVPVQTARRRCRRAAFLAALLALALPGGAGAYERGFDPVPGQVSAPPPGKTVDDAVNFGPPPSLRGAQASAAGPETPYRTGDGKTVYVALDGYAPDPAADQSLVDFLGSLLHGRELNGLHVLVVIPSRMAGYCGGEAAACYDPSEQRIFVVGEEFFGGLPTDYVIAHEYAHHVAFHRRNPPFRGSAYYWGAKRWATYHGACPGVASGKYSANPQTGYYRFPGEAWAEAFAYYHYRDGNHPSGHIAWEWHNGFKPTARSYTLIRTDVLRPWMRNSAVRRRGSVRVGGDRLDFFPIATPLDGSISVKLTGPRRADLDLFLLDARNRIVDQSTRRGSGERVSSLVCGTRRFKVAVRAFRGGGAFRLLARRP
ncbi:MAG TPA: hypothetical protein VKA89_11915 [Solirubrobacterales bacterium]|nr:hypothetical protein [Solirubrobacterales bacterium]